MITSIKGYIFHLDQEGTACKALLKASLGADLTLAQIDGVVKEILDNEMQKLNDEYENTIKAEDIRGIFLERKNQFFKQLASHLSNIGKLYQRLDGARYPLQT